MPSSDNPYYERKIPNQLKRHWDYFRSNTLNLVALWGIIVLLFTAIFAPWLAPYSPYIQHQALSLPPSWDINGQFGYFLGTDDIGRDILSRIIYGTQTTFGHALIITLLAGLVGSTIGTIAAFNNKFKYSILMHAFDSVLSIPTVVLGVIFVVLFGHGQEQVSLAIFFAIIPRFIRSIFNILATELEEDYIIAARIDGASNFYLFYHSLLPNMVIALVAQITRSLSSSVLNIAALGFLGLGAKAPSCEWGTMVGDAIALTHSTPWCLAIPSITIMLTLMIINILGSGMQHALTKGLD